MYENTINEILSRDSTTRHMFIGTFSYDEIPIVTEYPSCMVFNTEPRSEAGEHWLACYFDEQKNSYFFDSYGNDPTFYELDDYLVKNSNKIYYNRLKIQGLLPYCGFYCIFFLLFISRGKLKEFYKPFGKNLFQNDYFIQNNIK